MKKHANKVLRVVLRMGALILTCLTLAGACMVPSRSIKKENLLEDYIIRAFTLLRGEEPDSLEFGRWYRELSSGKTSISNMLDEIVISPESAQMDTAVTLDALSQLMTESPISSEKRDKYLNYLEHGVSMHRVVADLASSPAYFGICGKVCVNPGSLGELSPRDKDPEVTMFVYTLIKDLYYGEPGTETDYDAWCEKFLNGEPVAPAVEEIVRTKGFPSVNAPAGGWTAEEEVKVLFQVMVGQEINEEQEQVCVDALENGMSESYVISMISETYAFQKRCTELELVAGEVELTEPRDQNYALTGFLSRLYTRLAGVKPTAAEMNSFVSQTLEDPGKTRDVIVQMVATSESLEDLSDDEFLENVYEVFYDRAPEDEEIKSYRIGLSNGITRERVLSQILKDPAFDEKMAEYGIDSYVEPVIPEKIIALTFDDGPYTPVTMRILDVMEEYGAHATFFVVGNRVKNYQECVIRATNLNCEIADHTWSHQTLTKLSGDAVSSQINDCADTVYNLTGIRPVIMRPVGGSYNSTVSQNVGMPMIIWSVDTNDWKYRDSNHVINEILNNAKDGDIVLMHDLYETTATAVEYVVPELVERGYTLVTVSELAEYKKVKMEKGKAYFSMRG